MAPFCCAAPRDRRAAPRVEEWGRGRGRRRRRGRAGPASFNRGWCGSSANRICVPIPFGFLCHPLWSDGYPTGLTRASPSAAEGPEGGAEATVAAAAAAAGAWETVITKHPDGTEVKLYKHSVTGEIRWG